MSSVDFYKVKEGFQLVKDGMRVLSGGPCDYYMDSLIGAYEYALKHLAPFAVGDKVRLLKTPNLDNPEHGWHFGRHFIVKGAIAKVTAVALDKDGFHLMVVFNNQSWVDGEGTIRPFKDDQYFIFLATDFVKSGEV